MPLRVGRQLRHKRLGSSSQVHCPYPPRKLITLCPSNINLTLTSKIDYPFLNKIWEAMPAEDYVAMMSSKPMLDSPLKTQHLVGASRWEKISDTEVVGHHQLRVPHQKYTDETFTQVAVKGHAHSSNPMGSSLFSPPRPTFSYVMKRRDDF
ncbi:Scytalone dehydratase-domain-containing protein [Colletotrichum phormii]|uniref:Scytalone dehydratase-domain-containing protein n=1 Tax=Colletotrichum phormii TaxID=359342 RepID=A0AAJ0EJD0_9PEZI|nr:Scytalone dehydratase-domain-containing protein [Colletotrichum phormii]KAK1638815.1 Scytalone dehydratase-domain-containing protein [Colletotrichum phormii]